MGLNDWKIDVTNFEVNLSFLIKPFGYMIKKVRTKIKSLKNEKSDEIKSIFHVFKGVALKQIKPNFLEGVIPSFLLEAKFGEEFLTWIKIVEEITNYCSNS